MDPRAPTVCTRDAKNERWRVQCDEPSKTCLYTPDAEVDEQGTRMRPLDRIDECTEDKPLDLEQKRRDGYAIVAAIAPAPYGWMRDERGRVFQYNFDLHRRLYVGGGLFPSLVDGRQKTRGYVDLSLLQLDLYSGGDRPLRHRLRALEGEVRLAPFAAEGFLFRYELSERRRDPLLRVTTFVGRPRRTDLSVDTGLFVEAMRWEIVPVPDAGDASTKRWLTVAGTFGLWQSRDLYSYVRLRVGAANERVSTDRGDRDALTPIAAVEGDVTLDADGFHRVTAQVAADAPRFYQSHAGFRGEATRLRADVGYEVIILALNDQPVTLRLSGTASKRDDLPGYPTGPVFSGNLGLRFNLWAPAREP